jgi:hypothetical protein
MPTNLSRKINANSHDARTGLANLHNWPVKISTTIHGREKKKKRPGRALLLQKP